MVQWVILQVGAVVGGTEDIHVPGRWFRWPTYRRTGEEERRTGRGEETTPKLINDH